MSTGLDNLKVYILAKQLEIETHVETKNFPADEKYRSVDQIRRSSSSVTNNIAEAYNRRSTKDKIRILNDIAKCEAEETKRNLEVSCEKGFHKNINLAERYTELLKMMSGYIKFLKNNQDKLTNL